MKRKTFQKDTTYKAVYLGKIHAEVLTMILSFNKCTKKKKKKKKQLK